MCWKVNEYGGEVESRKGRKSTQKKGAGGNRIKTRRTIYTPDYSSDYSEIRIALLTTKSVVAEWAYNAIAVTKA